MFDIPFKNPLESETVSERRERKAKESEGSIRSSKSASRARLVDKDSKSQRVSLFGFARASKAQIAVKEDKAVSPAELPGSPVLLSSPPCSPSSPPYAQALSEFSAFTRLQEAATVSFHELADSPVFDKPVPRCRDDRFNATADGVVRGDHESPIQSTALASPIHPKALFAAQGSEHRIQRRSAVRYSSASSASTAAKSNKICTPGSTPGTQYTHDGRKSPPPGPSNRQEYNHALTASPGYEHIDNRDVTLGPISSLYPMTEPLHEQAQADELKWPTTILPLCEHDSLSSLLPLAQCAPIKILSQRLNEDWQAVDSNIAKIVDLQKKLWVLIALRRLDDLLDEKSDLRATSSLQGVDGSGIRYARYAVQEKIGVVHIGGDAGQGIDAKLWTDMPILPYQDSSQDLIFSSFIPVLLPSSQWPTFVQECTRVLKAGGVFGTTVLDPIPRNCGPLLHRWTVENLIIGLERRFLVTHPGMMVPVWLDNVADFCSQSGNTLSFWAVVEEKPERHPSQHYMQDSQRDIQQLRTSIGRHFYKASYGDVVSDHFNRSQSSDSEGMAQELGRSQWWWTYPAIVRECQDHGTVFDMVTYRCRKKSAAVK